MSSQNVGLAVPVQLTVRLPPPHSLNRNRTSEPCLRNLLMKHLSRMTPVTQGILLMIMAMMFLTTMDSVIKYLSGAYHELQLVWIRYAGQTVIAVAFVAWKSPRAFKSRNLGMQVLRSLFLFFATVCFFFGLGNIGLAAATSILQSSPILVAVAAYFFLGESLGWRKLAGVLAGLIGVFVIIRPGTDVFNPYALFPAFAAAGFAGYTVVTRLLSKREDIWTSFFYTAALGGIVASILVPFFWTPPSLADAGLMIIVAMLGATGQFLIIRSLFLAEASIVAPFGYVSILFAAVAGMIVFNEYPDHWTYAGAAVIVLSGLYIWHRESRRSKRSG